MAAKGDSVVSKACQFATLAGSKNPNEMTPKGAGKMCEDCWVPKYKKYNVKTAVDASVFPVFKEKGKQHMVIDADRMDKFIAKVGHEIVKNKKGAKTPADDAEVKDVTEDLKKLLIDTEPKVKQVATSKTGGVDKMTDASKYTGAHKERFDAEGKGKGAAGRVDKVENKGYVGAYKGEGTYDKKH